MLVVVASCLNGCIDASKQGVTSNEYPDINGLLQKGIRSLNRERPFLWKFSDVNGASDSVKYQPDSVNWQSELRVFTQIELNKPSYVGRFNPIEKDDLMIYVSTSPDKTDIDSVIFQYSKHQKIDRFSIFSNKKNELYLMQQQLEMELDHQEDEVFIKNYQISGTEKARKQQATKYKVKAIVEYP